MSASEEQARLRNEERRLEFAVRKRAREMDAMERTLERRLREFERDETETKHALEAELRHEHLGHEPERPPSWRNES